MPFVSGPETLPPPAAGADEVRRAAEEILARPEFQEPPRTLFERAQDFVFDRIDDVISAFVGGGRGAIFAWFLFAAAMVGVVYLVVRGLQLDRRRRELDPSEALLLETKRAPANWDAEAERFEAAGKWKDALRCRYRSLLASLARRGVIDEVPGRTAGEYRAVVAAVLPSADASFVPATQLFERAWYGNFPTGPDEVASFKLLSDAVSAGANR